jgi:alpha-L-rhamnosidase
VRLLTPGAETIAIVIPRTSLKSAKGTVPTQRGMVRVSWQQGDGGRLDVAVDLPVNMKARVSLPLGAQAMHSATGEGSPQLNLVQDQRALYDLGSGHSELVAQ